MPVMLANFANVMAASLALTSVLFPRSIIVRVKSMRYSLAMPSCPAAAVTPAMPAPITITSDW